MMAGIRHKNTKPELYVRSGLHKHGLRYRLHDKRFPGRPDLVFPRHRAALFINGCFWHGHECPTFKIPKTRTAFWLEKIASNKKRDAKNLKSLEDLGYRCRTVWECEIRADKKNKGALISTILHWVRGH